MFTPYSRLLFFSIFFLIAGCQSNNKKELPDSAGNPGTLVIVSDDATLNQLKTGLDSLFLISNNQTTDESPFVNLLKTNIGEFSKSYYNQKCVLALVTPGNLNSFGDLTEPFHPDSIHQWINDKRCVVRHQYALLAKHQHIVYLFGKDMHDFEYKFKNSGQMIINTLIDFDLKGHSEILSADTGQNDKYFRIFREKYGVGINIPSMFEVKKETGNFFWFQYHQNNKGIPKTIDLMVHAYNYNDTSDLSEIKIKAMRDTVCRHHILGELPGTYMSTSESDSYPKRILNTININGLNCYRLKGWWTIKGISMAGPFIRYIVPVPEKKLIFAFEGFIYNPDIIRNDGDLRLIEAIALSIK